MLPGIHALQPPVLLGDRLHLAAQAGVHAAILGAPLLDRGAAHAVFAARLGNRRTVLHLPQDTHDL